MMPTLYFGIDGVVNVDDQDGAGFRRYLIGGEPVNIPLEMPGRLSRLREHYRLCVLSDWGKECAPILSALGVGVGVGDVDQILTRPEIGWERAMSWTVGDAAMVGQILVGKAPAIAYEHVGGVAGFAWVDTMATEHDVRFLEQTLLDSSRFLVVAPDRHIGLTDADVSRLVDFAGYLTKGVGC